MADAFTGTTPSINWLNNAWRSRENGQLQQKWQALLWSPAVQLANVANQPLLPLPPQP